MTGRIFRSTLAASLTVLLASLLVITGCLYSYFGTVQERQLREELSFAAAAVEADGDDYLARLRSTASRLTWVAADGTVLYDTQADAAAMENHAGRQAIREALTGGSGSSVRYSSTLTEKTVYQAMRLTDGSVLRISGSQKTAWMLVLGMLHAVIVVVLLALGLSALLAGQAARRVVEPLNRLDLEHPLDNNVYEELSPLLTRIHAQRREIDRQTRDLKQRQDEFNQITDSMREGLVLLNGSNAILSINPAARAIFHADADCIGRDFLTVERHTDLSTAIRSAVESGHSQLRAERSGRIYQFDLSRIDSGGDALGIVLLAFDVTEQAEAERMRREFTANVSHELKTPLQSIIGSAELLETGLAKPEDRPRFLSRIHQEAERLVTLINDIIRLSQLDEGGQLSAELVDLQDLALETVRSLTELAAGRNVTLTAVGTTAPMTGVRRLLAETVYNLCENAVKYNVPGGSVTVETGETAQDVTLTVRDTGIGIPAAEQSRVFERFYRVDKSHSRAIGGTGLGLSIVKHAVAYHHGAIHLESEPGKGTVITVTLPKERPAD